MRNHIHQGQFNLIWRKGKLNIEEYFNKYHPSRHHKKMRYKYMLGIKNAIIALCEKIACEGVLLPTMVRTVHTYPGSTFHADFITVTYQYIIHPVWHTPHSC